MMKGIVIDETLLVDDDIQSTAIDEYMIRHVKDDEMVLHMFQHTGINMGYDDLHLKNFEKGLEFYRTQKERVVLRSSGGRSIVADDGVLSLSLIYRSHQSMDENYHFFSQFIMDALRPITKNIDVGEVVGACCPGKTDMSINNKKFCGTAQRKVKDGVALVCYISINGDQDRRNKLIKGFYDACGDDKVFIDENAMDSLSNLLNKTITVEEVVRLFEKQLARHTDVMIYNDDTPKQTGFVDALTLTIKRNEVLTHS